MRFYSCYKVSGLVIRLGGSKNGKKKALKYRYPTMMLEPKKALKPSFKKPKLSAYWVESSTLLSYSEIAYLTTKLQRHSKKFADPSTMVPSSLTI
jgi:hypothetical protein